MERHGQKVIVVGFDGATFDLLGPWVREGKLPTFAHLLAEGSYGELDSTLPPISAPAWASFATGKNPGKHGIFYFTRKRPGSYDLELMTGLHCKARPFWDIAGTCGRKVIIINIPMTFPPRPVNGVLVSGLDAPGIGSKFTYPATIQEEILQAAPDYQISLHLGGTLDSREKRLQALEEILTSLETRAKVTHLLAQKYSWDVLVVKFNSPDVVQHHFWRFMDKTHPQYDAEESQHLGDAILQVYQKMDALLADFMTLGNEKTSLVVISDHGAGPRIPKAIYLNEWLCNDNLLAPVNQTASRLVKRGMNRVLRFWVRRLTPAQKDRLRQLFPGMVSRAIAYFKFNGINWAKTQAYVGEFPSIRINMARKERQGVVSAEEYEALRTRIMQGLQELKDPQSGKALIEHAFRREEVYTGPYVEYAPDIIVVPKDHMYTVSWKFFSRPHHSFLVDEPHWRGTSGRHKPNGILIAKGPLFHKGRKLQGAQLIDIAPTLLYVLGIPVPRDMDGRVLSEMFSKAFLEAHPIAFQEGDTDRPYTQDGEVYSPEEARQIRKMLEGLGYLEGEED